MFQADLNQCLSLAHPLIQLSKAIDWSIFEEAFGPTYAIGKGRSAKPIRHLVGLHYLKHPFKWKSAFAGTTNYSQPSHMSSSV